MVGKITPGPAPVAPTPISATGPTAELVKVLTVMDRANATDYERFCAVLVAYAESDFNPKADQFGRTFGVFQQNPAYWAGDSLDTMHQAELFLAHFRGRDRAGKHNGDPVHDAWWTQQWMITTPYDPKATPESIGDAAFKRAPETVNYTRRVSVIDQIIRTRTVPR